MRKSKSAVLAELGKPPASNDNIPTDYEERDEILRKALLWMNENCTYVPLDVEEDINLSYAEDSLEDFRETVRGWLRALRNRTRAVTA